MVDTSQDCHVARVVPAGEVARAVAAHAVPVDERLGGLVGKVVVAGAYTCAKDI